LHQLIENIIGDEFQIPKTSGEIFLQWKITLNYSLMKIWTII